VKSLQANRFCLHLAHQAPDGLGGRRQPSAGGTSRGTGHGQARICERLGAKFPGPTRQQETERSQPALRWRGRKAKSINHRGDYSFCACSRLCSPLHERPSGWCKRPVSRATPELFSVLVGSFEAHHFDSGVVLQLREMLIQPAVSFPYSFVVIGPVCSKQRDKREAKVPL